MRKFKTAAAALPLMFILLFAASCADSGTAVSDAENYIYAVRDDMLIKYNVHTGIATAVCEDPLCEHDSDDCLFYNADPAVCVFDNKIYFCRHEENETETIYEYDLSSGKSRKIRSDIITDELYNVDSSIYLWNTAYDEEGQGLSLELLRYETETGKWQELARVAPEERGYYLSSDGEKIYWYNDFGEEYATDYEYLNRTAAQIGGRLNGGYVYSLKRNYTESTDYHKANSRSLYRKKAGEETEELLCGDLDNYVIVGDRIVYITSVVSPSIAWQSPVNEDEKYYDNYEGCVYSMDLSGNDKKILADYAECNIYGLKVTPSGDAMVRGEYAAFELYGASDDGTYGISPNLLIVNAKTGEYKITKFVG